MQLNIQGVIHPDAQIFAQEELYKAKPDAVVAIMTQISLNAGLKELWYQYHTAWNSEMKQLHFRKTSISMHQNDLTHKERQMVLESNMLIKEKQDRKIKGRMWTEEINSAHIFLRRMIARQLTPQSP